MGVDFTLMMLYTYVHTGHQGDMVTSCWLKASAFWLEETKQLLACRGSVWHSAGFYKQCNDVTQSWFQSPPPPPPTAGKLYLPLAEATGMFYSLWDLAMVSIVCSWLSDFENFQCKSCHFINGMLLSHLGWCVAFFPFCAIVFLYLIFRYISH